MTDDLMVRVWNALVLRDLSGRCLACGSDHKDGCVSEGCAFRGQMSNVPVTIDAAVLDALAYRIEDLDFKFRAVGAALMAEQKHVAALEAELKARDAATWTDATLTGVSLGPHSVTNDTAAEIDEITTNSSSGSQKIKQNENTDVVVDQASNSAISDT